YLFCSSRRRRHTRSTRDWSSDVCSSDLLAGTAHRQPHVVALATASDGHVHVGDQTVVPEVAHVVGVRGPRPDSEELPARLGRVVSADDGFTRSVLRVDTPRGPAVELRALALVRAVILPAEVAVHEVALAVEALAVLVLV